MRRLQAAVGQPFGLSGRALIIDRTAVHRIPGPQSDWPRAERRLVKNLWKIAVLDATIFTGNAQQLKKREGITAKAKKKAVKRSPQISAKKRKKSIAAKKLSPAQAQAVVFRVIRKSFPNAQLDPDQLLKQYGYNDGPKLLGLRDDIYADCAIFIGDRTMLTCKKISDVINKLT